MSSYRKSESSDTGLLRSESFEKTVDNGNVRVVEDVKERLPDGSLVETKTETKTETKVTEVPSLAPVEVRTMTLLPSQNLNWASPEMYVTLIVTLLVVLALFLIGGVGDAPSYWESLNVPSWGSNLGWQAFFLGLAVLVFWLGTFMCAGRLPSSGLANSLKIGIWFFFGLQLVVLIIAVSVLFRQKSLMSAFYLVIVLVVLLVVQAVMMVYAGVKFVGIGFAPLVLVALYTVWLVYESVFVYRLSVDN
jgi:hypothetical protein